MKNIYSHLRFIVITVLFTAAIVSNAATKTWVPTVGGTWTTAANWSPSGVPVAGDDVVIGSDQSAAITAVPTVALSSLTISGNCTLQSTAGVTLTLGGNAGTDFTISSGKTLTLGNTVNITLAANATATLSGNLTVGSASTFNTDGTSVVSTVLGTVTEQGAVTCNTASKLLFQAGSTFIMANNTGLIPISTWALTSTCIISGYTSTTGNPTGYTTSFAQSFGNFTWNCTGQASSSSISMGGRLTTINGDFTVSSTGAGSFSFGISGIGNITIGGNYTQTAGYVYASGYATLAAAATRAINIAGNFSLSGGTFNLSNSNDAASATTLNIGKDFTQASGTTLTETGSSTGSAVRFVSSATPHVYTSAGTTSNTVNFIVDSGATLQMGTAASPSTITGGGSFTLQSGATLNVTSPAGISATGTNTGNIQCTGTRSYSAGNINYVGNSVQATGNGLTAAANVSILNTSGVVTFTVQAAVAGNISMAAGATANLGAGFTHTASSLTLGGVNQAINNTYGGNSSPASIKNATYFPNTATGIISLGNCIAGSWTGAVSTDWHTAGNWCSNAVPTASDNVNITAATNQPLISAAAVCNNITINAGATVTLAGSNTLTVSGTFNNNGSFTTNDGTLTVAGNYTNSGSFYGNTGTLVINSNTTSAFTNNGTFTAGTGTVNLNGGAQTVVTPSQTQFYNVIVGGTGLKTINSANFVVMGTLSMEQTGTLSAQPVYGVPATLQYNRTVPYTTGVEWPATFSSTGGVVVKNTGVITLAAAKTFTNCPLRVYDGSELATVGFALTNPNAVYLYCAGTTAGSKISGTGLLTLGGDVTVLKSTANGAAGATVSCPVALTNASTRTFAVADDGSAAADLTLSNVISTTGTLVKTGEGALTLSGNNTYSGGTTLGAGTLNINHANALGASTGTFTIVGGSIDNTSGSAITTGNYPIALNADVTFIGTNNLNLGTGNVTLNADRQITTTAATLTIGGVINDNTKSLTKAGSGTLSFGSQAVTLKDLTISSGTLTSTSGNLGIAGNFINSGTFTHNSGTVTFNGAGAQTINIGSSPFYNLNITNTAAHITAGSDVTSAGTFTTNAGSTINMGLYGLAVNNVAHSGTLNTQSISDTPLSSGKTWGGLVNYNGAAAQTAAGGTYNNLTISTSAGGAKANGDITVNGILNLSAPNASATVGALEMVTNYNNYPCTNSTYLTQTTNPIVSYLLTMGPNATTIGQGDVTGKIYRNSLIANTEYSFGNQYTTYAFTVAPTTVTVTVTIGTAYGTTSTWGDPYSVQRSYEMEPTGGTNALVTMNLHYLDSELNGNTIEENLVTGDYDIGPTGNPLGDEHGRSSLDIVNNFVGLSGVPISYFIFNSSTHNWRTVFTLHKYYSGYTIWDGSLDTSWEKDANWSNGVPGVNMTAIIPDASTTLNDPSLTKSISIGGIQILEGGILNFNSKTITIKGNNYSGWEDQSGVSHYTGEVVIDNGTTATVPILGIPHFSDLTIKNSTSCVIGLGSHIYISGTLTKNGTLNVGALANTLEYNGTNATQNVVVPDGNGTYYSLALSGSGTKTLPTTLTVSHDFTMAGSAAPSGTTLNVGGNFTNNSSGSLSVTNINLNGTTSQTLGGSVSTTFTNLAVNNTAGITLGNSETVTGTLALSSGLVTTGSNTLTMGCSSTYTGGSSTAFINGKLSRLYCGTGSKDFPIGKGGNYRKLTVNYTALTGTSTVTTEQFESVIPGSIPANTYYQTERHWNITESGGSSYTYALTLDGTGFTPESSGAAILKGNGTDNSAIAASYPSPNFSISGQTSFSNFAVASSCSNPVINTQPSGQIVCEGSPVTFTVAATGPGTITYQWRKDGTDISGATASSYTINSVTNADAGNYSVLVTRSCGASTASDNAALTVNPQPQGSFTGNSVLCGGQGTLTWTATAGTGPYTVVYYDGTANRTASGIVSGTPFNPNSNPTSTTTYSLVSVTDANCTRTSGFTTESAIISVISSLTWNGSQGTDWHTAANWTPEYVPVSCTDVLIPVVANYPVLSSAGVCNNLTIESGASLLDNSNLTIGGTATVKRNIPVSPWMWHFLSSPVVSQPIWPAFAPAPDASSPDHWTGDGNANWNWDVYYWNPKIPNLWPNVPWVNLRQPTGDYNSGSVDATGNDGWDAGFGTAVPVFTAGRGYLVSYGNAHTGAVMDDMHSFSSTTGTKLNTGTVNAAVDASSNQWNLIGNPFPSSIDWKASSGWDRSKLYTTGGGYDYWIWNDAAGNYGTFNSAATDDAATLGTSRYIAPAQGFWVAAQTIGNVQMANGVRLHSTQSWLKSSSANVNSLRIQLTSTQNLYRDEMIVSFSKDYPLSDGTMKFPSMYDEAPEIWSVKNNGNYSIDRYNTMPDGLTVNLSVKAGVESTYTLTATNIDEFNLSREVMLDDLKTGARQNLVLNPSYTFSGAPSDKQERFRLTFNSNMLGIGPGNRQAEFSVYFNGAYVVVNALKTVNTAVEAELFDAVGRNVYSQRLAASSQALIPAGNLPPGTYIVRLRTASGVTAAKVIIY